MIERTNCVSQSEFELWHHSQNWPQSLVKLGADLVPQAVNLFLEKVTKRLKFGNRIKPSLQTLMNVLYWAVEKMLIALTRKVVMIVSVMMVIQATRVNAKKVSFFLIDLF